ncbi:DUF6764 family protein [Actinomycetes bacterium M1A6_2h]
MSLSTRMIGGIGVVGTAIALAVIAPGAASAAPTTCLSPAGAAPKTLTDALSGCASISDATSAAAAYGYNGTGDAAAKLNSLALALGFTGGDASATGSNGAAPAAIAYGLDAVATATGTAPGLSIAIAAPGSTVSISDLGAVCDGPGFAGSLVTLQACLG